ncbi:YcnI family protein [Microbacterium saperdae]
MNALSSRIAAAGAAIVAALAFSLAGASAASAHVSVSSSSTEPGAWAVLSFRAPTESATASAVKFDIRLPEDTPFTSVRIEPNAGWTAELVETELAEPVDDGHGNSITRAVTQIVWTADAGGLAPGEFGVFNVSVGPLPASGTLFFPVVQNYSDGTEVGWVQQAADGEAEPEHPAPKITIAAAAEGESETADVAASVSDSGSGLDGGLVFSIVGAVFALAALVLAGIAVARTRR